MRYAPTVFGAIFGGRAITVEGTFYRNFFMPRRTGTLCLQKISAHRTGTFLMLQIALARRTGTFWCCKLYRLVVPVLFDVSNCIGSSYR